MNNLISLSILVLFCLATEPMYATYDITTHEAPPILMNKKGEKIFLKHADACLAKIEAAAKELDISGSAMIAFIPGDQSMNWVSKMKVMGRLANDKANYLGIAYTKASEMAVTLKNSGNADRASIKGEFGYQGGVIREVDGGYLVGAFSGATGEQDAQVSAVGLDWLAQQY
ncbi:MAG: hypothetical protein HKN87_23475 [Saprospiraceae bacterium]|nr:hypothetical protein [Saprospiraceae bacterium]